MTKRFKLKYYLQTCSLSVLLLFIASCEYKPTGTPFTEVVNGEPTIPLIELTYNFDTIYLSGDVLVSYTINTDVGKVFRSYLKLNGEYVYPREPSDYYTDGLKYIIFTNEIMNDGVYELSVEAEVSTNSGTIADKTRYEQDIFTKSWTVFYYKTHPKPKITYFGNDNGSLKLEWTPSVVNNFRSYTVFKAIKKEWGDYWYFDTIAIIDNATENYFVEDKIPEEKTKYFITTTPSSYSCSSSKISSDTVLYYK